MSPPVLLIGFIAAVIGIVQSVRPVIRKITQQFTERPTVEHVPDPAPLAAVNLSPMLRRTAAAWALAQEGLDPPEPTDPQTVSFGTVLNRLAKKEG